MRLKRLFKLLKPPRGFSLTKAGKIFFVFQVIIIVVAMLTGNNLLFIILSFMLAFMIVSGVESEWNIRHLEIDRVIPSEIFSGAPAQIGYHLKNTRRTSLRLVISELSRIKVVQLPKGQGEIFHAEHVFKGRGVHALSDIKIFTTYPYGLFEKSITFDTASEILVFPEPLEFFPRLSAGREDSGSGKGSDSISHVRPYIMGDPASLIVWKKLHRGLFSRVVEGGSGMRGVVILVPGGNVEEKLGRACFLINESFRTGSGFGLVLNSYFSGIASTRNHKLEILSVLARADHIGEPAMEGTDGESLIYV